MDAMAMSLVLVGLFSFIYHATLHPETQFLDEMSMFFLGSAFLQPLYTAGFDPTSRKAITTLLISLVVGVSAVYYQKKDVLIHLVSFAVMENLIWPRLLYLIYFQERPAVDRARLARQFWAAVGTMVMAIVIWLIDLELCYPLRDLRGVLGAPWAFLFELHGWWHVFTAVAASKFIALIREVCPRS